MADSIRQSRRRAALEVLIQEAGGVTELARLCGSASTHFSAITAGRRGIGDTLAAKFEQVMGRPPGWMDRDTHGLSPRAVRMATLWDQMPEGLDKERAHAVALILMGDGSSPESETTELTTLPQD